MDSLLTERIVYARLSAPKKEKRLGLPFMSRTQVNLWKRSIYVIILHMVARDLEASLGVVLPAWNEQENLDLLLPEVTGVTRRLGIDADLIVVDGGSKDGTVETAARHGARVVLQQERGYGGALMAGFDACRAPFVVTMDADLSHPAGFVEELWNHRNDADVLIASRYVDGGRAEMMLTRRALSHILNRTFGLLLALPFRDLSSGFRLYKREALAALDLRSRDFDVLEEILIKVFVNKCVIREVPFHYQPRGTGRSHARLLKFGWAYLRTLLRMAKLRFRSNAPA
jgi:dolichol-phosphate mannosyltransferase